MVVLEGDVALHTGVCNIQIVGLCRIFSGKGIYLFYYRKDAIVLAQLSYNKTCLSHAVKLLLQADCTSYLEVGETIDLSRAHQFLVKSIYVALLHLLVDVDDMLQLLEEPLVNLSQFMDIVNGISLVHSLRDDEDTLVCRFTKGGVDIRNLKFLVLNEAVHTLTDHTETLLDSFLEVAADSHYLTDRLHR